METLRVTLRKFLKSPEEGKSFGFAMILYETKGSLIPAKMGGPLTVGMKENDWFVVRGEWRQSTYRGMTEDVFNAKRIIPDLPTTPQGVKELLARTFIIDKHGIDRQAIARFVDARGGDAARMIERDPNILLEMSSNQKRFGQAILLEWGRRNSGRQAVSLMESAGIGQKAIENVLEIFRDDAVKIIKANPYKIAWVPEIGFSNADKIGSILGIPQDDPRRVTAAVADAIGGNGSDGHTYTPLAEMSDHLRKNGIEPQAIKNLIKTRSATPAEEAGSINFDIVNGEAVAQNEAVVAAERKIAVEVARLLGRRPRGDHLRKIREVTASVLGQEKYSRFDDIQRAAVAMAAMEPISILTGGPGTGKSTVTEAIAEIAAALSAGPVVLLAPTGKAAVRLAEATKQPAKTVHRGLKAKMEAGRHRFELNSENPLPAGCFVVIDEASMLDAEVAASLLSALPPNGRILFAGDRFQLPSIGPGYVLGDMLSAKASNGMTIPSTELVNVYRTSRNSSIATGAAMLKNGELPALDNKIRGGLVMFEHRTPTIVDKVSSLIRGPIQRQLGLDPRQDVAILCPQAPGPAGTWEINARLSSELNPEGKAIEGIFRGQYDNPKMPLPRVGDRVMLTKNDPDRDVMNGDVGTLVDAYVKGGGGREKRMLKVAFDSGQVVDFPVARWRELILSYAMTGHKSQGSQYPLVIMPLTMAHAKMLERTLVYTEWTRAQDFLMLVGEREALELAAETVTATQRRTRLRSFIENTLVNVEPIRDAAPSPSPLPERRGGLRRARPAPVVQEELPALAP
jgi:exodeoxyribonuclease V alpha subunit